MSSLPKGWLTRDSRRLPAVRASGREEEQVLPLGWEEHLHLPYGCMGSRSTGWEEQWGHPRGWRARDSEWGSSRTYHINGYADMFCSRRRCSAEAGARQQATARASPAGLPHSDRTKIQLMMKRTIIKINSPVMRFSKTMT